MPSGQAIDLAARHLGLVEPTPHFAVLATNATSGIEERLFTQTSQLLAEHDYTHYGVCSRDLADGRMFVVALSFRWLSLRPVPRQAALGTVIVLEGSLNAGHLAPELAVETPNGEVVRGAPMAGPAFALHVPTHAPGLYRVELLAQGRFGTEVVANFPVYVAVAAPRSVELSPSDTRAASPAERTEVLLGLINRDRKRAGLAPVVLDAALGRVAAGHVQDMLDHGFVGHTSTTTGSCVDRLARAGIRSSLVLENIGRGASLADVHAGLMDSPGHRGNLLHPQATNVGIGIAVGGAPSQGAASSGQSTQADYLVTEVFTRVTPRLESSAAETLLDAVNRARKSKGQEDLHQDSVLRTIAEHAARKYFETPAKTDAEIVREAQVELARSQQRARSIGAVVAIVGNLADLATLNAVLDGTARDVGIGLAQGNRPDTFPGAICAVLLLAH